MFQTYLFESTNKDSKDQIEYLIERYCYEQKSAAEVEYVLSEDWLDGFEWFCTEAAALVNLTEEQFYGLGQIASKCSIDDLVYVIWPHEKKVTIWLNWGTNTDKALKEFGQTISYRAGEAFIAIPFGELKKFVDTY
jgi:hypothetical protein